MGRGLARALHTLDENCPAPSVRWEAVNPRANRVRLVPDSPTTEWPVFLYWARKFYESPQFEKAERNYKFRAVRPLKLARKGLLSGSDWVKDVERGFTNTDNNPVSHWEFRPFPAMGLGVP